MNTQTQFLSKAALLPLLAAGLVAAPPPLVLQPGQPNTFRFAPQHAKYVRLLIQATSGGQACVDELEVYGSDERANLALAAAGAKASASSCLHGYAIHQTAHLNDGLHGNSHSWIAGGIGDQWAQIELPHIVPVGKIVFSRDREGTYRDRMPVTFALQLSLDGKHWQSVSEVKMASISGQRPAPAPYVSPAPLPDPVTPDGLVRYAFLCERATWQRVSHTDHLSPLVTDRPALPCGQGYWNRIARLTPTQRVLAQLEDMIERLAANGVATDRARETLRSLRRLAQTRDDEALYLEARWAKRQLMLQDPALAPLQRILFIKRHPYLSSHNYSDVLDSQFRPGGGVCVLEIPHADGSLTPGAAKLVTLFDASGGIARDAKADFEADTIYFAYRPQQSRPGQEQPYWHLMATAAQAGQPARQLTDGPFHDYYPCPLPDGGLAFVSTRCKARFLCWRPQAFVLFRMDGDQIRPLSFANLSEWTPTVMRDGRLLWTRSEYIDKGADFGHTLWAVRPDGSYPSLLFGNNTPNCYINGHEVPGTREILCTIFSHGGDHNGPLGLIDLGKASTPFDSAAVTNITPDTTPHYNMKWPRVECWRDPVPITRDYFLASHAPADRFGIYLADRWGNRELLYLDPEIGSMSPTLLRPEPRPPVLSPNDPAPSEAAGQLTVADVYQGLAPGVPRGKVKYLRVVEEVRAGLVQLENGEYRRDHGPVFQDFYATPVHKVRGPNGWPSYVAKAVLGVVPVEADGSASFVAPAGKVLYFQALDENYNELQRMRSVVQLQPGEQRGCIGCHEHRHQAPPTQAALASLRPPSRLEPPPWGAKPFAYELVVQPVLNGRCVSCHNAGDTRGINLTAALDADKVPASYRTLIEGGWVHYFDMTYGLRHHEAEPGSFGTSQSKLWKLLDAGHYGVKLTRDEVQALKCWIDLNCPLWPDYQPRDQRPGPSPLASATSAPP